MPQVQLDLDRAVAKATGESLNLIRSLGFGIADPTAVCYDPELPRRSQSGPRFHRRTGGAQRKGKLIRRRHRALNGHKIDGSFQISSIS